MENPSQNAWCFSYLSGHLHRVSPILRQQTRKITGYGHPDSYLSFKVRAAQVIHEQFSLALTQTWKAKRGSAASTQSSGEWMISMKLQLQYFDLPHLLVMKRCGMNDNQGCLYFSKTWKCFCPLSGEEIKQDS